MAPFPEKVLTGAGVGVSAPRRFRQRPGLGRRLLRTTGRGLPGRGDRRWGSITEDGGREVLGVRVGDSETEVSWTQFLRSSRERGRVQRRLMVFLSPRPCQESVPRRAARPLPGRPAERPPHVASCQM
ncbi:transposase [Streptomyces sp. NPDC048254]|uniref:transposase n=1 Tax=Streptomyces sp. NPDC048254 TaxID=3365525 RepID=UPI0037170EE1